MLMLAAPHTGIHYTNGTAVVHPARVRLRLERLRNLVSNHSFDQETTMIKLEKVLYTAKAHTTGGRDGGASRTDDGRLDVRFALPGGPAVGTNPEQLFAVGWSACLLSAIKLVAHKMKVTLSADVAMDPEVDLGPAGDGYALAARLNVSLPGIEREVAERIVAAADQLCPYSRATRGNIDVRINVV
jgi:Ohr subfamily peroxiredoxin